MHEEQPPPNRRAGAPPIDRFMAFGHEVLTAAGRIAASHFRTAEQPEDKSAGGAFDPVTAADRLVESCIRERIEARFPGHGIVGEEYGVKQGTSAWRWIIDPIDGTRAFVIGLPVWGCLLGLLRDDEPVLGFMHQPVIGETFCGDGARAWLERDGVRKPMRSRAGVGLPEAVLCATHPDMFGTAARPRFERLAACARMTRYGGDCYNYCLLAHGLVDLVVEDGLKPYDILPLVPIVRGAGGAVTDLAGNAPTGGLVIAAANAVLHQAALRTMRG